MFRRTRFCSAALTAISGVLAAAGPAFGQPQLERVEITGSAIRRIDAESALPVQVIKREDIARSGATSVTDLLQRLPYMQGHFGESGGVGGGAGGVNTASVHNVGDTRTLVLLNGHRLAQFGGQTLTGFAAAMDLNALPLASIERVEILTDGASALYGADAIAGVINFITRRNISDGDVSVGISVPRGGAREKRVSATKGFGSLEEDGFNVLLSLAHDERTRLNSTQRDFAESAEIKFNHGGKSYRVQQVTVFSIPGNAYHDNGTADPNDDYLFNPYYVANGRCPDKTFLVSDFGNYCAYNFVRDVEVYPARKRSSILGSVNFKVGDHTPYVDWLYSESKQNSQIAPVRGTIAIPVGSPLHDLYLAPTGAGDSEAYYRLSDLGNRTYEDKASFLDFSAGSKGLIQGWDYNAFYSHSQSKSVQNIAGMPGALAVAGVIAQGLDPFVGPGQQTPAIMASLNAINYKGYWDGGISKLDTVGVRASRELIALPAGPLMLGGGVSFQRETFASRPSLFAQGKLADPIAGTPCDPSATAGPTQCDQRFGDAAQSIAYSSSRDSYGAFGELIVPAYKGLEFITSMRVDHYDDFGNATTAKGGFRWQPDPKIMVRGSVGTGFRAPTVPQVNAPQQTYGVTFGTYSCGPELQAIAASLGATCRPGPPAQYDVVASGNTELKPEKSRQRSLGIRLEPGRDVTLGADLWYVRIKNSIGQLTEEEVFANPQLYGNSWTAKAETGTPNVYVAFLADNKNLGTDSWTGLDIDATGRMRLPFAALTSRFALTYMIREQRQLTPTGRKYSAIGGGDEALGVVTFRWLGSWANTFQHGNWAHTFTGNFRSGYLDSTTTVEELDASGNPTGNYQDMRLPVKRHVTLDWQTQWNPRKDMVLTVGLLNVFNTRPPLAISSGGGNRGQQYGYDDRYYSPLGRVAYLNASYKF